VETLRPAAKAAKRIADAKDVANAKAKRLADAKAAEEAKKLPWVAIGVKLGLERDVQASSSAQVPKALVRPMMGVYSPCSVQG
jgi:hypothetical protein